MGRKVELITELQRKLDLLERQVKRLCEQNAIYYRENQWLLDANKLLQQRKQAVDTETAAGIAEVVVDRVLAELRNYRGLERDLEASEAQRDLYRGEAEDKIKSLCNVVDALKSEIQALKAVDSEYPASAEEESYAYAQLTCLRKLVAELMDENKKLRLRSTAPAFVLANEDALLRPLDITCAGDQTCAQQPTDE